VKKEPREKAKELAKELKRLLEENLPKHPSLTHEAMTRVRAIQEEIQQMGIKVTWESTINTKTLTVKVDVTLWKPKKDMSPKSQKIYDEWFMKVNKIKPPQ